MTETAAQRRDRPAGGAQPAMGLLWIAFIALMAFSSGTLDSIWEWLRSLPLAAEIVMWIIALPWALGLLVWESSWEEWLRVLVVVVMALLWTSAFGSKR
jgi:hypothetical protein